MRVRVSLEGGVLGGLGEQKRRWLGARRAKRAPAVFEARAPLAGDLHVGFAGGGMPVNIASRRNYGMSDGIYHMLTRGVAPDFAIIMKPVWRVYAEEPGMCWFKVSVRGTMGYAGISRGTPGYRSSIIAAA